MYIFAEYTQNPIVAPQVCHCLLTVIHAGLSPAQDIILNKYNSGSLYCPTLILTNNNSSSNKYRYVTECVILML